MIIEDILKKTRSNLNQITKTSCDYELSTNLKQFKGISLKGSKNTANRILFCNVVKCLIVSFHSGRNLSFSFHTNGIDDLKNTKYINGLSDYSAKKAVELFIKKGLIEKLGQTRKRAPNLFRPLISLEDFPKETKIFKERTFIKRRKDSEDLNIYVTGYKSSLIESMEDWKKILESTSITIPVDSISKLTRGDNSDEGNHWLLLNAILMGDLKNDEVDIRYLFTAPTRIFNQRTGDRKPYRKGGRFYCDGTSLPKAVRKQIKIDGQETIELDYASLHPTMLAALQGKEWPIELYTKLANELGCERKEAKIIFNSCLNRKSRSGQPKGISYRVKDVEDALTNMGCSWLIDYLFQDRGLEFQYLDSKIAQLVIQKLTSEDIVVICLHDSFIVQQCHEELLRETMQEAWELVMDTSEQITIKPFPYRQAA